MTWSIFCQISDAENLRCFFRRGDKQMSFCWSFNIQYLLRCSIGTRFQNDREVLHWFFPIPHHSHFIVLKPMCAQASRSDTFLQLPVSMLNSQQRLLHHLHHKSKQRHQYQQHYPLLKIQIHHLHHPRVPGKSPMQKSGQADGRVLGNAPMVQLLHSKIDSLATGTYKRNLPTCLTFLGRPLIGRARVRAT